MSRQNTIRLAPLVALLIIASLASCGPDPADPKSPAQVLLDHAIGALWGDTTPSSLVALQTRSTLTETQNGFSSTFELETLLASDNRYRETRSWKNYDLSEVSVVSPKKSWRLVDGTVVELREEKDDTQASSLQSWLFAISKLEVLKDTKRFKLKHRGVHDTATKSKVERLEIHDKNRPNIGLTMDFDQTTWLLERVTLTDESSGTNQTIILRDYRVIDGIQFAHEIDSEKNGEPYAQQRDISYVINPAGYEKSFLAPQDMNRESVMTKKSISGVFAVAQLDKEAEDITETVDALRSWIIEQKLEIAGPLVVVHPLTSSAMSKPTQPQDQVAIAIKPPTEAVLAAMKPNEEFGVLTLKPHQALCLTQVGDRAFPEIRDQIAKSSQSTKVLEGASALEIYFSREGTIRQVQIPIRSE